jgi:hypothetical protein
MPGKSYRGELPAADEASVSLVEELHKNASRLAVDIGERNAQNRRQTPAEAADGIETEFKAAKLAMERQEYRVPGCTRRNAEAEVRGSKREIVLVGAHYRLPWWRENRSTMVLHMAITAILKTWV